LGTNKTGRSLETDPKSGAKPKKESKRKQIAGLKSKSEQMEAVSQKCLKDVLELQRQMEQQRKEQEASLLNIESIVDQKGFAQAITLKIN